MARKSIDANTLRFLYGKSGNKCAFPDCCEPIFEDDGTLTGECCHIEAFSRGGARFNPETTIEEKNAESNLILLCARHHKIIDSHPQEYTTTRLKEIKQQHEKQYLRDTRELNDKMLFALRQSMKSYWRELQELDKLAEDRLKIEINTDANIEELQQNIEELFNGLERVIMIVEDSDGKIIDDLKRLCERISVDYSLFEQIPYYENSLINRNWEMFALGFPNHIKHLKLYYLELCVKVYEKLVTQEPGYGTQLEQYKRRLKEHHEHNYHND